MSLPRTVADVLGQHVTLSTVLDLPLADVQWGQFVALFPVVDAGKFVTSQALLAVVLDAGRSTASALAMEDLRDAGAELRERDRRGPFVSPAAIP